MSQFFRYRCWMGLTLILLSVCFQSGCRAPQTDSTNDVFEEGSISIEALRERESVAESRAELEFLLQAYRVLDQSPGDRSAYRTRSASLLLLLGASHARNKSEQRDFYRRAREMALSAMCEVPAFASALESGQPVPEAAGQLPIAAFEPLLLWSTATFYTFRDVASFPERVLFNRRLQSAARVIELMIDKEPGWGGGTLQFSLGIYYLSVPEVLGGDRQLARQLMDEAAAMSDKRLLPRWGRAKYLAVALDDKDLYLSDLRWVQARNPLEMDGPAVWNRYFIKDATALLDAVDEKFSSHDASTN